MCAAIVYIGKLVAHIVAVQVNSSAVSAGGIVVYVRIVDIRIEKGIRIIVVKTGNANFAAVHCGICGDLNVPNHQIVARFGKYRTAETRFITARCGIFTELHVAKIRFRLVLQVNGTAVYGAVSDHFTAVNGDCAVFHRYCAARTVRGFIIHKRAAVHGKAAATDKNTAAVGICDLIVRNAAAVHYKAARLTVYRSKTGRIALGEPFAPVIFPVFPQSQRTNFPFEPTRTAG